MTSRWSPAWCLIGVFDSALAVRQPSGPRHPKEILDSMLFVRSTVPSGFLSPSFILILSHLLFMAVRPAE